MIPEILLTVFSAFSANESCHSVSFDHLNMRTTEAGFCLNCAPSQRNKESEGLPDSLSFPTRDCFETSIKIPLSSDRYRACVNIRPPSTTKPNSKLCPTPDYISRTAQVFHEVTRCLGIENPEHFFALINQESRFQITAESHTGASCYGQLTGIAVEDINRRFLSSAIKRMNKNEAGCENLRENWEKLSAEKRRNSKGERYWGKTETALCRAHSNPYSCMLYSTVYYQHTLNTARKVIDSMDMILVRVQGENNPMIFKDEKHYKKYFSTRDRSRIVSEKRISLIQDRELTAQILAFTAYNGGPGAMESFFTTYIDTVKGRLWHPNSQKKMISMLFSKVPWGIPTGDFLDTFTGHMMEKAKEDKNDAFRVETAKYAKNVLKGYEKIAEGRRPACGNIPKAILKPEGQYKSI